MSTPPDPFSQSFDAIDIDPARTPSSAAIDQALAFCAPSAAEPDLTAPGFYLIDDAGGRFIVDREMGVVALADEKLLIAEPNALHGVRLRVIEPSGRTYELPMRLRITGVVPQMVGAEEFASLAGAGVSALTQACAIEPVRPAIPWQRFAVVHGAQGKAALDGDRAALGAALAVELPTVALNGAALTLAEPPPLPSHAGAAWSLY